MLWTLLGQIVEQGTLTVVWPDGKTSVYGAGAPRATMRLHGSRTPWAIGLRPELAFGEAYMDGRLTVEEGSIADVLQILISNLSGAGKPATMELAKKFRTWFRPITQLNSRTRARRNVAHHYDLSGELYDLFLDADRQYSCAYFREPKMTLEAAQAAKKRHIAAKLKLDRPDFGCWISVRAGAVLGLSLPAMPRLMCLA